METHWKNKGHIKRKVRGDQRDKVKRDQILHDYRLGASNVRKFANNYSDNCEKIERGLEELIKIFKDAGKEMSEEEKTYC